MPDQRRRRGGGGGCALSLARISFWIGLVCIAIILFRPLSSGQGRYSGLTVLRGDADCDGQITVADAARIVGHVFRHEDLPAFCSDSVTIFADSVLVIKRLVLPIDSAQYACGTHFAHSLLQKFLIYKRGALVDSAAWIYALLPISLNKNILPPESLGVKD